MSLAGQNLSVFLQPILVVFIFPVVAKDSIGVKAWILKSIYQGSNPGSARDFCSHQ